MTRRQSSACKFCGENIRWLDAVLLTHAHADHIMGLDDCRRFCDLRGFAPPADLRQPSHVGPRARCVSLCLLSPTPPKGYFIPEPHVVDGPFVLGDLNVTPLELPHGRIGCTGYMFTQGGKKRLAYLTDCKEVPPDVVEHARGAQAVVLDALRLAPHPTHMCLDEALTAARRIGAERTYFTHLTHDFDHDLAQAELPEGVHFAWDGLRVELD